MNFQFFRREQPIENFNKPSKTAGNEQWFDCSTHSSLNSKAIERTPTYKTTPSICPPAPCRHGFRFDTISKSDDSIDLNESGVLPLDESLKTLNDGEDKPPESKRLKREKEERISEETSLESNFLDLLYMEAVGTLLIRRKIPSSDEPETRECKILVSYRIHKEDSLNHQIALIIYKPNSINPKTRRNLMEEFDITSDTTTEELPKGFQRQTPINQELKKRNESEKEVSATHSPTKQRKASKTSLRF